MRTGLRFKGVHTDTFGVTVSTGNRPILPTQKRSELDSPTIDGSFDFSEYNPSKRSIYQDRIIEVEFAFKDRDVFDLQHKISRVAVWLMGQGELVFDDLPDVIWRAKIIEQPDYTPLLNGKATRLKIRFKCSPWSVSEFGTEGTPLESSIRLNSGVPLDICADYTFALVRGDNTITVKNPGSWYVRPIFELTTDATGVTVKHHRIEGHTLSYTSNFKTLHIDFLNQKMTNEGVNVSTQAVGQYPELAPGDNEITINLQADSGTLFVRYNFVFVYGSMWE